MALIQEKANDASGAEATYLKALSNDPTSASTVLALGQFYARQKRWADAEKQLQAAIALEPKNLISRSSLALVYLAEGRKDASEQTMRDAKEALKTEPSGYRVLGDYYVAQGELERQSLSLLCSTENIQTTRRSLPTTHDYC